jgi:hypothetical protein
MRLQAFHVKAATGKVETVIGATKKERPNKRRDRNMSELKKSETVIEATKQKTRPE